MASWWQRVGLLVLILPMLAMAEPWRQPSYIEQAFMTVALGREYQQDVDYLVKWQQGLRVFIRHQVKVEPLHVTLVTSHLEQLAEITGLNIDLVTEESAANVVITFTEQAKWQPLIASELGLDTSKLLHGSVCLANIAEKNGRIEFARVYIPVDLARFHGKLVACVVEELTQILGLPNDSDTVFPSIFNDNSVNNLLTGLDWLLLRLLYQPELVAGSRYGAVQVQTRAILLRWQQDGTLANAVQAVRRGKLYPLLGY
ncbi:DUF2927 domain-containing protein [Shewanella sp. SNU WT4]|uniref:DUF2927 domain-containing protein n=1 Tax=Shewanella sp. SNU WT4 TaxID=2590015 RepID=UPI0011273122|nr:DUF2927 domain-containing protein [Shewanella sp. SNU WT4]QDF67734.1 DUF2927 domain-containing protein [Shewanella sp. SNU WT4]